MESDFGLEGPQTVIVNSMGTKRRGIVQEYRNDEIVVRVWYSSRYHHDILCQFASDGILHGFMSA